MQEAQEIVTDALKSPGSVRKFLGQSSTVFGAAALVPTLLSIQTAIAGQYVSLRNGQNVTSNKDSPLDSGGENEPRPSAEK